MVNSDLKLLDTNEYISMLKKLVSEGNKVSMIISGNSMSPFLMNHRDKIVFAAPERDLRRGDMVFFQRETGQYVMHRILKKQGDQYYMIGDAQTEVEGPIRREQIFARITEVERKGKLISDGDFWWWFFEKIWIRMIPLRKTAVRTYRVFHEIRKKLTGKE